MVYQRIPAADPNQARYLSNRCSGRRRIFIMASIAALIIFLAIWVVCAPVEKERIRTNTLKDQIQELFTVTDVKGMALDIGTDESGDSANGIVQRSSPFIPPVSMANHSDQAANLYAGVCGRILQQSLCDHYFPKFGTFKIFSDYSPLPPPDEATAIRVRWNLSRRWPLRGIQMGRGPLDVQHYALVEARLQMPQHRKFGTPYRIDANRLELVLVHESVNASKAISQAIDDVSKKMIQSMSSHGSINLSLQQEATSLKGELKDAEDREIMVGRQKLQEPAAQSIQSLCDDLDGISIRNINDDLRDHVKVQLDKMKHAEEAKLKRLQEERVAFKHKVKQQFQDQKRREEDKLKRLKQKRDSLKQKVFDVATKGSAETKNFAAEYKQSQNEIESQEQVVAKLPQIQLEEGAELDHRKKIPIDKQSKVLDAMNIEFDKIKSALRANVNAAPTISIKDKIFPKVACFQSHLQAWQQIQNSIREVIFALLESSDVLNSSKLRALYTDMNNCVSFPSTCSYRRGNWKHLQTLQTKMLRTVNDIIIASRKQYVDIIVPLQGSRDQTLIPLLHVFDEQSHSGEMINFSLREGVGLGYSMPYSSTERQPGSLDIVTWSQFVPSSWLKSKLEVLKHGSNITVSSGLIVRMAPNILNVFAIEDDTARDLHMRGSWDSRNRSSHAFRFYCAVSCFVIVSLALVIECSKKRSVTTDVDDKAFQIFSIPVLPERICGFRCRYWLKTDLTGRRRTFTQCEAICFLVIAFLLGVLHFYVLIHPILKLRHAYCLDGFRWKDHYPYLCYTIICRLTELGLYFQMGGVGIGLVMLLMKLFLGMTGSLDYYTDSMFLAVTYSCRGTAELWGIDLWLVNGTFFLSGVLLLQVLLPFVIAIFSPSRRIVMLMKLLNLEVLSEYYNPYQEPVKNESGYEIVDDESAARSSRRSLGFQKLKAISGFLLTCIRIGCEDGPSIGIQWAYKNQLPTQSQSLALFSICVGFVAAGGGLFSSCLDLKETWSEVVEYENGETSISRSFQIVWARCVISCTLHAPIEFSFSQKLSTVKKFTGVSDYAAEAERELHDIAQKRITRAIDDPSSTSASLKTVFRDYEQGIDHETASKARSKIAEAEIQSKIIESGLEADALDKFIDEQMREGSLPLSNVVVQEGKDKAKNLRAEAAKKAAEEKAAAEALDVEPRSVQQLDDLEVEAVAVERQPIFSKSQYGGWLRVDPPSYEEEKKATGNKAWKYGIGLAFGMMLVAFVQFIPEVAVWKFFGVVDKSQKILADAEENCKWIDSSTAFCLYHLLLGFKDEFFKLSGAFLAIALALVILGAIAPYRYGDDSSLQTAVWVSISKWMFAAGVIAAMLPMCTDFTLDTLALEGFWETGQVQYFTINLAAIVFGAFAAAHDIFVICSSWKYVLIFAIMALTFVTIPAYVIGATLFVVAFASEEKDMSEQGPNLFGWPVLVSILTQAEGFVEGMISMLVQGYAAIHDSSQDNVQLLLVVSVTCSVLMVSKAFAMLDLRLKVSRLGKGGVPLVVGVAPLLSMPFFFVGAYRIASVVSRFLLFILVQEATHADLVIFGASYGGVALAFLDGILQAANTWCTTRDWGRVVLCIPNVFSPLEPLLHGGASIWSTTISWHALFHFLEEAISVIVILAMYRYSLGHHIFLLKLFGASAVAKYPLLFLLRKVCAYSVDDGKFYAGSIWFAMNKPDIDGIDLNNPKVEGTSNWQDKHFIHVAHMSQVQITEVRARGSAVTDYGVKEIARNCPKLEYINLDACTLVTDDSIKELAQGCMLLKIIDLGATSVTDAGIKELANHCRNLTYIQLECTEVTDAGVQELANRCRDLKKIDLFGTPVTDAGVKELKAKIPGIRIGK